MPTVLPWQLPWKSRSNHLSTEWVQWEKLLDTRYASSMVWQEVSPWSKIDNVDTGAVKKSRWTHRKANENQWSWQFAYLWSRNWPHSRLATPHLQVDKITVASFFFCFLLSPLRWEGRSSTDFKVCGLVWPAHCKLSWPCTLQTDTESPKVS